MARASEILRQKLTDERGNIFETVIWKVAAGPKHPEGLRYRLAFIRAGEDVPAVLYDNHHPKGHHRHVVGVEQPYAFSGVTQLISDFLADVRRVTGGAGS